MKTEIKIKPCNGKFDFFIHIDLKVVYCKTFTTTEEIEEEAPSLLATAKKHYEQAAACELVLNSALREVL